MCEAFQATLARYPHELALRTVGGGGDGHLGGRRRVRCWLTLFTRTDLNDLLHRIDAHNKAQPHARAA